MTAQELYLTTLSYLRILTRLNCLKPCCRKVANGLAEYLSACTEVAHAPEPEITDPARLMEAARMAQG